MVHTDYNGLGKLQYLFGQKHTVILDTAYEADVTMIILVPAEQKRDTSERDYRTDQRICRTGMGENLRICTN